MSCAIGWTLNVAVYLIRAGDVGPVKIGYAADPIDRLVNLQTAHWEQLHLLRIWEGELSDEAALHLLFSDLKIAREWFSFSRKMLGDVGLKRLDIPEKEIPKAHGIVGFTVCSIPEMRIEEIIRAGGGPSMLGKAVGLRHSSVLSWVQVPPKHVAAVSAATGIPKHILRPDLWAVPSKDAA